ncbi:hypothetical protein KMP13_07290 [Epibacterium ulvae]|uniref:hypothetical protein n=1 Tax=Epibacterium ulvae TaxID=1156985 RepID=UPI001BFCCD28|nr:hypothetical protein [Epibacterium ulvae]MBT8153702.1 hypothetical protein [Epibacterium ulvae]
MLKAPHPAAQILLRSLAPLKKAVCPVRSYLPRLASPPFFSTDKDEPEEELSERVVIPVQTRSEDEQQSQDARDKGLFLARQERWDDIVTAITQADRTRSATGAGLPIADILAFGARSDVMHGTEQALENCPTPDDAPLLAGIMALEEARLSMGSNPIMNAVVALAHVDLGWAWRSDAAMNLAAQTFENRAQAHFKRAWTLMQPLHDAATDSPFLLSAYCTAMATQKQPPVRLADAFAQLIELDPLNFRNMRALGAAMAPSRTGSCEALELEARRTAVRTQEIWGAGGYTWTYFDALTTEDQACLSLDVPFFMEGLRDIVENRPSQETVNLLIAFCAVGLDLREDAAPEVDIVRETIARASDWLVRDHLQEIHPLHWAHASVGFANNAQIPSPQRFAARGRANAHRFLQQCFREELAKGHQVQFTRSGLEVLPN